MKSCRTVPLLALVLAVGLGLPPLWNSAHAESDGKSSNAKSDEKEKEPEVSPIAQVTKANRLAARGALSRAIPHYEKALKAGAEKQPSAHYNLAEVLKAQEEFGRALLHYQAYLLMGDNSQTKSKAKNGIQTLKSQVWNKKLAKLSVDLEPETQATILIDGFPVARNQDLKDFELVAGSYDLSAQIVDHKPLSKTVKLENEGSKSIELKPVKKTFYGTLRVSIDQKGATVKVKPEELDAPRKPNKGAHETSPIEEPIKLETGKWLLEVTKEDHHRWVRYVKIKRGKETSVQVELEKKLPEEIR